jgi:hypothetical protein
MRKFFIIIFALNLILSLAPAMAKEAEFSSIEEERSAAKDSLDLNTIFHSTSLLTIINQAINILWVIAIPLSIIMIVWAGIELVSSGGDSKKVASARNRIKYTLIGLVVMILASSTVALVQNIFIQE